MITAPPAQTYGVMSPTIGGQTDPESQYVAQLLKSLGSQPQGNATGLDSNLMAEALLQYAQQQRTPTQTPMQVGPMSLTGAPGLADTSSALPDVSYG